MKKKWKLEIIVEESGDKTSSVEIKYPEIDSIKIIGSLAYALFQTIGLTKGKQNDKERDA